MSKLYSIETELTYSGTVFVFANSPEEAIEAVKNNTRNFKTGNYITDIVRDSLEKINIINDPELCK